MKSKSWNNYLIGLCLMTLLVFVSTVRADRIFTVEGGSRAVTGTVLGISNEKVTVDVSGERREIPANTIRSITFDDEPSQLASARGYVADSNMSAALEALSKVDRNKLPKDGMKADYDYVETAAKAKQVMSGSGNVEDATKALNDFLKNNRNSYRYYEICELYGDFMVQQGKFDLAKRSYETLAKAPWPDYALKANVSLGMADVTENKIEDARKLFESVLASDDDSEQAKSLKSIAKIGLALCQAGEKKFDEAIKTLEEIARSSSSEDMQFQALLFNSLGSAYQQAGKANEAILAYLHTDIMFSSARSEHIKALQALSKLWRQVKRNERADAVDKQLKELYNIIAAK